MQKTKIFNRVMSAFLAVILMLGLVPSITIPAHAAEDGMPDTITFKHTEYGIVDKVTDWKDPTASYDSPRLNTVYVQDFRVTTPEGEVGAFCGDHTLRLNNTMSGTQYRYKEKIDGQAEDALQRYPYLPFLDIYFWEEEEGSVDNTALSIHRLYAQTAIWLTNNNKLFKSVYDKASLQLLIDERNLYYAKLGDKAPPQSEDPNFTAMDMFETFVSMWDGSLPGYDIPHRNYYVYEPYDPKTGKPLSYQPLIIPELETENEPKKGFIRLEKTDSEGLPLGDCEFTIYSDSSCMDEVGTFYSGSDGVAIGEVEWQDESDTKTFWVVETSAKDGYVLAAGAHPVTVDSEANATEETAAVVEGSPFENITITDQDIVRKVNQHGAGIGPATFLFDGSTEEGGRYTGTFDADETGLVTIQWWKPEEVDTYIPPGHYKVTEEVPPPGCEISTEAKYIDLWIDEEGLPHHSGALTFTNRERPGLEIKKESADNKPLAGAVFEIYKDGRLLETLTTDETGTIRYDGPDGEGLEEGYYIFVETEAPPGCLLPTNPAWGVYVNPGEMTETLKYTRKNYEYPEIVILKMDNGGVIPLAGAFFEVMIDGTNIGRVGPSGPNGKIVISYEEYGEFLDPDKDSWTIGVREVSAPKGYLIDDDNWQYVELRRGQTLAPFEFTDTKYPEIHILKRDRDTGDPVPGTSFKVEINGVDIGTFITTGEDGIATITYEDYERFLGDINGDEVSQDGWGVTVTEVEVTPGYNKDLQPESGDFSITKHLQPNQSVLEFVFEDTPYRDLLIRKYDSTNSWLLQGAHFYLESITLENPEAAGPDGVVTADGVTNENGELLFEDLPNGTYKLTEVTPPTGYDLADPHEWEVVISSNSKPVVLVEAENHPREGLLITKHDAITNKPLENVEFMVRYLGDGNETTDTSNEARPYMTDENGVIYIPDIVPGWYEIRETRVPDGYVIDPEPRLIEVVNNHGSISVPFYNYQDTQLIILKKDNQTGEPLPGARFVVTTAGGSVINANLVTGANGYATLNGLEPGSYVVREVEAPDGHLIDSTPQTFEIRVGQTEPVFLVFGNDGETTLYIRKEDAQTRLPVADAVFELRKADGEIVERRLVTGPDGLVSIDGLEPGDYIVEEIEAPPGYLLAEDPEQIVNLEAGETETVLFRNNKPGGIV